MPTRAGVAAFIIGAGCVVLARIVGALELYILGVASLAVLGLALAWVSASTPRIEMARLVRPDRIHVGDDCWIELHFTNRGRRRSAVIDVVDDVTTTAGASVLIAPLAPGEMGNVRYRVTAERRGEIWVGPLTIGWSDPFGLVRRTSTYRERRRVLVYPTLLRLGVGPRSRGVGATPSPIRPDALGRTGDDVYALRGYVPGDDPRRIHWPSSARHDDLIVRQAHHPTTSRAIVIIDDRAEPLGARGLDLAASAAGSVLLAAHQRGDEIRLMTASGSDTGYGTSTDHLLALLERLALMAPTPAPDFDAALGQLGQERVRAAVVIVSAADAGARRILTGEHALDGDITWVALHPSAYDDTTGLSGFEGPAAAPGAAGGALIIDVVAPGTFPALWAAASSGGSIRRGAFGHTQAVGS